MKYNEIIRKLETFKPNKDWKWNESVGLSKFAYFMDLLGNPQDSLIYVHIGGTSGKGSTSTILASILKSSGYKTGLHVSPHVLSVRERAQINGKNISQKKFVDLYKQVEIFFDDVAKKFNHPPSYYEILLAISFLYFKNNKCDIVVLEVGLGGRLDATNIIKSKYQIITNIGLDHTKILGSTKDLILKDKQEIIKNNSTVITGITEDNLKDIIENKIKNTDSKIFYLNNDFIVNEKNGIINFSGFGLKIEKIKLNLKGIFQQKNMALAIAMAINLKNDFKKISLNTILNGVQNAKISGRFQFFSSSPIGILDGAHNPDKTKALVESIKYYYPNIKWITIFRYKRRDDIEQSLDFLREISQTIIITGSKRAGDMGFDAVFENEDSDIVNKKNSSNIIIELDLKKAYLIARDLSQKDNSLGILATGSIYMINEFLKIQSK